MSYANVVATAALVVAVGGGALAVGAIPDGQGKINACYVKKGRHKGDVRLLVSGTRCRKGERRVSWNQKGRPGDPGPAGAQGQTGAAGARGTDGAPGTARAYAIIDPSSCASTTNPCTLLRAKNVAGARWAQNGFYCVTPATGIESTEGFMAGVEWYLTAGQPGLASAMPSVDTPPGAVCPPGEFAVATERHTDATTTSLVNDVAFWFAVP